MCTCKTDEEDNEECTKEGNDEDEEVSEMEVTKEEDPYED